MTLAVSLDTILDDLRTLVEVESPSGDVESLTVSARVIADLLERRLGGRAVLVDGPAGPHVHWSGGGAPRVLVLGHHDTVFPLGTLARRPFTVADGKITGPGVFDMLGGLVQAVHAVALLDDRSGVEILVTADEENGSLTSRALLEDRAQACGTVLVLEGAGDGGDLKVGRKGCGTFEVTVTGRASHAGLEPEAGVNALVEAAHQVLEIAALNRPEAGTTVTPTVLRSGGQSNVVPDAATIVVDVRVETADETARVEAAFAALTPRDPQAVLAVRGSVARPPMTPETSTDLFALAASLEPGIRGVSVGGGSDGNFTAALGIPTLDGLGAVGGGAHADTEHVLVDTVVGRVHLVGGLLRAVTA